MTWTTIPENHTYDSLIASVAASYGVDPALVKAHMMRESLANPRAIATDPNGTTQSFGLMQLEYSTAQGLGYTGPLPSSADQAALTGLYDPQTNLSYGAALIAQNLARAATLDDAIAAYNAGWSLIYPGKAPRNGDGTYVNQAYVDDVEAAYTVYLGDFAPQAGPTIGRQGVILGYALYALAGIALAVLGLTLTGKL